MNYQIYEFRFNEFLVLSGSSYLAHQYLVSQYLVGIWFLEIGIATYRFNVTGEHPQVTRSVIR